MQANVRLIPPIRLAPQPDPLPETSMRALLEHVVAGVRRLRRERLVRGFYFMRKPPGLRLRFALRGGPARAPARDQIAALMDRAVKLRLARSWFPSAYEPEVFKFGGPAAMGAVHAHVFADTQAWWRWQQPPAEGDRQLPPALLSMAVLNDLFARFVDGPEEIWDVWRRLAALHGDSLVDAAAALAPVRPAHLVERVGARHQRVLRAYEQANARFARACRRLHERGRLLYAYRLLLPHVALGHWNRLGLSLAERRSIYAAMTAAWAPSVHGHVATKGE